MSKFLVVMMFATLAIMTGCGESAPAPTGQQAATSTRPTNGQPTDPIARVAYDFFDAVLKSDKDAARAKLTPLAIQRIDALGMDFLLPVSTSASFSVGASELIEADIAAVDTILREVDPEGQRVEEAITVVLRKDYGNWGVMGVVTGTGPNEQLDGFNFERPDEPFNAATFGDRSDPSTSVPQQAARPAAQDPFRQ